MRALPRRAVLLVPPLLAGGSPRIHAAETGPTLLPLPEAVARVAERYRGRLLDARLAPGRPPGSGGPVYELRWLTPSGDLLRVRLDAVSGAMIEVDGPAQFDARIAPR